MLKSITLGSLEYGRRFLETNRESLSAFFDDSEEVLFGQISSAVAPTDDPKTSALGQSIRSLLNSPILKLLLSWNPLVWVLEGMSEGLGEELSHIKLPDLGPLMQAFGDGLQNMGEIGAKAFFKVADAIGSSLLDLASDPSRALAIFLKVLKGLFRDIFGTVRDVALEAYDTVIRAIGCIPALLTEVWVIPDLTDTYEDLVGQPFSLLNYATFTLAAVLEFMANSVGATQSLGAIVNVSEGWSQGLSPKPLYSCFREAMDQTAIEAKYPGPSLPEHTQPIIMMVKLESNNSTTKDGKCKSETIHEKAESKVG